MHIVSALSRTLHFAFHLSQALTHKTVQLQWFSCDLLTVKRNGRKKKNSMHATKNLGSVWFVTIFALPKFWYPMNIWCLFVWLPKILVAQESCQFNSQPLHKSCQNFSHPRANKFLTNIQYFGRATVGTNHTYDQNHKTTGSMFHAPSTTIGRHPAYTFTEGARVSWVQCHP